MRSARMRPLAILSAVAALVLLLPAALPATAQGASAAPTGDGQALATRSLDILGIEDAATSSRPSTGTSSWSATRSRPPRRSTA